MNLLLLISMVIFLACKPKDSDMKPNEGTSSVNSVIQKDSGPNPQAQQDLEETTNEVGLHLFDDDERIIVLPKNLQIEVDGAKAPQGVVLELYSTYLDLELDEAFTFALGQESASPEVSDDELNLTAARIRMDTDMPKRSRAEDLELAKQQTKSWKKYVRTFEYFQDIGRQAQNTFKSKGPDYKTSYFEKAVQKKWADDEYSKFDSMQPLTRGKVDVGASNKELAELGGDKVFLGMAPTAQILKKMRDDMHLNLKGGSSPKKFKVISLMEDFELRFTKEKGFEFFDDDLGFIKKLQYKGGRFKKALNVKTNNIKDLGVYKWRQYSTPDRTMMSTDVLDKASDSLVRSMKGRRFVYVHCKSGKGRSATVVVTARVKVLIDKAKSNNIQLTKQNVDDIVADQINAVKQARDQIGISDAQRTNMLPILYERAKFSQ